MPIAIMPDITIEVLMLAAVDSPEEYARVSTACAPS
jgi:hypothetical protein